jgi:uncharacterized protein YdaU (DUF1376 family)
MSSAPSMPMFWDAYLADTTHLSTEEHGAYLLLLAAMWRRNGSVPDNDRDNARILGLTPAKWRQTKARLAPLLIIENGQITQKNLLKIWKITQEKISANRMNGAKGGRPKTKENNAVEKPNGFVSEKPNGTIPEPEPEPIVVELCSARTGANEFRDRCFKAAGLDPQTAMAQPGLVSTVSLEHLIRDPNSPCDPDLDVIPAIQTCAAGLRKRGQTLNNWSYCREAALRNRDQRLAGNPAPIEQPAAGNGPPARQQKHSGSGTAAAGKRIIAKLRESRGQHDDYVSEAEPQPDNGMAGVFSNCRRIAGTG